MHDADVHTCCADRNWHIAIQCSSVWQHSPRRRESSELSGYLGLICTPMYCFYVASGIPPVELLCFSSRTFLALLLFFLCIMFCSVVFRWVSFTNEYCSCLCRCRLLPWNMYFFINRRKQSFRNLDLLGGYQKTRVERAASCEHTHAPTSRIY